MLLFQTVDDKMNLTHLLLFVLITLFDPKVVIFTTRAALAF
jgi:hypothetical protein